MALTDKQIDYIIVGQGLAGTALAIHLIQLGQRVLIIDQPEDNSSSRVAAGLYNPVTGRKMVKTWNADKLFPYLNTFYTELEKKIESDFYKPLSIYRPFLTLEEQNEWMAKSSDNAYKSYIQQIFRSKQRVDTYDDHGGILLAQSGYVAVNNYLNSSRKYFVDRGESLEELFDCSQLEIATKHIKYKGYTAKKIIFCTGAQAGRERWFNWLPFKPVKGEILTIKSDMALSYILNRGIFIIPQGGGIYKIGSTYDNHDHTLKPTEKARNEIIDKFEGLINAPYEIIKHEVGLRPASKDRKPMIGLHPVHKTIGIFNGLGAKGVSLSPYYARQFAYFLAADGQLDEEVNIIRFNALYTD